jgi:aminoglycoside 6-adenylyltransferase
MAVIFNFAAKYLIMRSEAEIKNLIIEFAKNDVRVRAVILNGSRANPKVNPDRYQDFDIVFIVDNLKNFTKDHNWTNIFGDKIISQLPDDMTFGKSDDNRKAVSFHFLMLFYDGNRIDLTLFPLKHLNSVYKLDSLSILWLDKDNLFSNLPQSSDKDYHICKPTEKEFLDTCNEFWWVIISVAKGIKRNEITYSKQMLETVVRPMFMKIIEWKIGIENDFDVSFGKEGRFMKQYLSDDFYKRILLTYSNFEAEENWKALFIMTDIFFETSIYVAVKLSFNIDRDEMQKASLYLKKQYHES